MIMTSAQAAKTLKKLNEERQSLFAKQGRAKEFIAAVGENIDDVRPEYDFCATQAELNEVEAKIRKLKHALNMFNCTTVVDGFDMTIDEMLVYIPQLSYRKDCLAEMKDKLAKTREAYSGRTSSVIDYRYLNYDLKDVDIEYEKVASALAAAQNALDLVNNTKTLEVEL